MTKVLIAYASKYGATAEIAAAVGGVLEESGLSVTVAQAELAEGEEESVDASAQVAGGVVDRVKSGIGRFINRKRG